MPKNIQNKGGRSFRIPFYAVKKCFVFAVDCGKVYKFRFELYVKQGLYLTTGLDHSYTK